MRRCIPSLCHLLWLSVSLSLLLPLDLWAFPQVKIDRMEWMNGSRVRLYATFLDAQKRPVQLDNLSDVTILRKENKARPEPIASFSYGQVSQLEDTATLFPREKSESGLDLIIIAPATLSSPWLNPAADAHLRKGVSGLLKSLAKTDKANLIWVGDHLFSYVPTRGKTGALTNLNDQYDECIKALAKAALSPLPEEPVPTGGELEDLHEEACGLVSSHGEIGGILENPLGHGGYYPNLFGIRVPLPDIQPEHPKQQVLGTRKHAPLPALGEAFKMLLRGTQHNPQKQIVLISDGEDGYLHAEADALLRFREKDCPRELEGTKNEGDDGIDRCAQRKLDQFRAAEQDRFLEAASSWLAMAHAAGIRIHGIGLHSSAAQPMFLSDRVQVLAIESGGSYRYAPGSNNIFEALTSLADEMAGQYVIEFDSGLKTGEESEFRIQVGVDQGNEFESRSYPLYRPVPPDRIIPELVGDRLAWLQAKVGFYWYRVIYVIVATLLVLLALWGIWKFIKGLRKKIQKRLEKEKKGLKKRAKGAASAGRGGNRK